ncbi:hypothetical protein Cantr_09871 [Candida viswanathii]|uniref:Ubiquitin-like protease family profile domain-containing protein n=1 Tax=Candida viswanathii TaxID=5486 RepID=A0A367YBQ5_9ASCO|nr:hypothetical protein Cantr_09871 [Candida viswanathii]
MSDNPLILHRFRDGTKVVLSNDDIISLDGQSPLTGKIVYSLLKLSYTKLTNVLFLNEEFYDHLDELNQLFGSQLSGTYPNPDLFQTLGRSEQLDYYYHEMYRCLNVHSCLKHFTKVCFPIQIPSPYDASNHWVGIVIEQASSEIYLHVLDPTEKGIYPQLNDAISKIKEFCRLAFEGASAELLLEYPVKVDDAYNSGLACVLAISRLIDGDETNEICVDEDEGRSLRLKYKALIFKNFITESYVEFSNPDQITTCSSNAAVVELLQQDRGVHISKVGDEILVDFGYVAATFEFFLKLVTYMDLRRNTIVYSNSKNFIGVAGYFQCPSKCCSVKYQRYITGQAQLLVNLNAQHKQPTNVLDRKQMLDEFVRGEVGRKEYVGDLEIFKSRLVAIDRAIKELNKLNYHEILQRIKPRLKAGMSASKRAGESQEPHDESDTDYSIASLEVGEERSLTGVLEGEDFIKIEQNHLKEKYKLEKKHLNQLNMLKEKQLKERYELDQSRLSQLKELVKRRRTQSSI